MPSLPSLRKHRPSSNRTPMIAHFSAVRGGLLLLGGVFSAEVSADPIGNHLLEQIEIRGRAIEVRRESNSASEGVIGNTDLALQAIARPGDVLAMVPGMVVSQHSGSGKANQYFLRGFNLDHGTDFAMSLDGMPLNAHSHGHGQGYADLNFVIPELVQQVQYQKGPYQVAAGDFSAAGSTELSIQNLTRDQLQLTLGDFGYRRLLAKGDQRIASGNLLAALELQGYDGPWRGGSEDVKKISSLLRYSQPWRDGRITVMAMHYQNQWHSADQIPWRLIEQRQGSPYQMLDPSSGGDSRRSSLSLNAVTPDGVVNGYYLTSSLQLWSNFSYFLADPNRGDQFLQQDKRSQWGGQLERRGDWRDWQWRLGWQGRWEQIPQLSLWHTQARQPLEAIRQDALTQQSQAVFGQLQQEWQERWRWQIGARVDRMAVQGGSLGEPAMHAAQVLPSLKSSLAYQWSEQWSWYLAIGQAFHSNDARAVLTTTDPAPLLVKAQGQELGARWLTEFASTQLNLSMAWWQLNLDSELRYVGDEGLNAPSRASKRQGLELAGTIWQDSWQIDGQVAWSTARYQSARFTDGSAVEGAVPLVVRVAWSWQPTDEWAFGVDVRHLAGRRLDATSQTRSASSQAVSGQISYHWQQWEWRLQLLNALNSQDADMAYAYSSRLADEIDAQYGLHQHPMEPRALRLSVGRYF